MVYEALLLAALLLVSGFVFLGVVGKSDNGLKPLFQIYLLVVIGIYFVWFWCHGGQTVAMKAWRIKLINDSGSGLAPKQAVSRYLLAIVSFGLCAFGIFWAILDRDRKFLHDRLLKTSIVFEQDARKAEA